MLKLKLINFLYMTLFSYTLKCIMQPGNKKFIQHLPNKPVIETTVSTRCKTRNRSAHV